MRCSIIQRCVSRFVVLLPIAFCAGNADAQSPAKCRNSSEAGTRAFHVASERTDAISILSETPIWKTITVGDPKGVNAIRAAIEVAPCFIWISDEADEILG